MRETPRSQGTAGDARAEPPQPRLDRAIAHTTGASGSGTPHRSDGRPPHTPRGARQPDPHQRAEATPPASALWLARRQVRPVGGTPAARPLPQACRGTGHAHLTEGLLGEHEGGDLPLSSNRSPQPSREHVSPRREQGAQRGGARQRFYAVLQHLDLQLQPLHGLGQDPRLGQGSGLSLLHLLEIQMGPRQLVTSDCGLLVVTLGRHIDVGAGEIRHELPSQNLVRAHLVQGYATSALAHVGARAASVPNTDRI